MSWFSEALAGTQTSDSDATHPFAVITDPFQQYIADPFQEQFGDISLPTVPITPFWEMEGFQIPQIPQLPTFPEWQFPEFPKFPEWQFPEMPDLFGGMSGFFENYAKMFQGLTGGVGNWFGNIGAGIGGVFGGVVQWFGKWWWAIVLVLVVIVLLYFSPVLLPALTGAGKGMKGLGMASDVIGIAKKFV